METSPPRITIATFSPTLGGLEQVFADYCEALQARGCAVSAIVAPGTEVTSLIEPFNIPSTAIKQFAQWDVFAVRRLRAHLQENTPDVIICHGNRAIGLLRKAAKGLCPVVGVTHSINVKHAVKCDYAIAINEDMRQRLLAGGLPESRVFTVFNMIKPPASLSAPQGITHRPPVIGTLGRFVPKKGFDIYLNALAEMMHHGTPFRAVLGGGGDLEAALRQQAERLGLNSHLEFTGWVEDKAAFFNSIDVFCFTSRHDVCPVVLLEAYMYGKPVVITDIPGPVEIASHLRDAWVIPPNNPQALAGAVQGLLADEGLALRLGQAAQQKLLEHYTMEVGGSKLMEIVTAILDVWGEEEGELEAA